MRLAAWELPALACAWSGQRTEAGPSIYRPLNSQGRRIVKGIVIPSLLLLVSSGVVTASTAFDSQSGSTSSATQVVSPTALATWVTEPGRESLDLLVLWRGSPGWFLERVSERSDSSSRTESGFRSTSRYGHVELSVEFDRRRRVARINGVDVRLGNDNVILVDKVDDPESQRVARTLSIRVPMVDGRVASVIRQSSDAVRFLRCDVQLEDTRAQGLMRKVCGEIIGRSSDPL